MPLVSVVIPSYNSSTFLKDSIESIVNQSYGNIEIILIDDGSTDDTEQVVSNLKLKALNLFYFKKTNGGISSALNFGVEQSKGYYIARMDSDDVSDINRIMRQVEFMQNNSNIDLISTSYITFGNNNENNGVINHPCDPLIIKLLLSYCSPVCHPAVLAKANIFKEFKYSSNIAAEDHKLWCEVAESHTISNLDEPLLLYRRHNNSLSRKKLRQIRMDTLLTGFKHFWRCKKEISNISLRDMSKNKIKYKNIKWLPAYFYWFMAKFIYGYKLFL